VASPIVAAAARRVLAMRFILRLRPAGPGMCHTGAAIASRPHSGCGAPAEPVDFHAS
jgi:hypothetical protein